MADKRRLFSLIPKVDDILNEERIMEILEDNNRDFVVKHVRQNIENIRKHIVELKDNEIESFKVDEDMVISNIIESVEKEKAMNLRRVINATGVVLHTNLGRALINDELKNSIWDAVSNYSNLEYNIETGKRGSRYSHIEEVLGQLTGAESAMVVNNNAAAVLLVLSTMAKNKEVIVSRGQLVEIGGAFRVPEVMEQGGALLKEVGTTNKTHVWDYENAIGEETGLLLKVHTSNYKVVGFTKEVSIDELVEIGNKYNLPTVEDIGSGTLVDFSKYGIIKEPTVQESIKKGIDVVTFSGDKLLGGPQAGIIVGKKKYIDAMKKNPLTRAIRIDKLTLAALEGTLRTYLSAKNPEKEIPTLRMLTYSHEEISEKAHNLYEVLINSLKDFLIEKEEGYSQVGGGSMPTEYLKTTLIKINHKEKNANWIEKKMRESNIPVIGRISEENILLDVRTIKEEEFNIIKTCLVEIEKMAQGGK
ncbi:L-seryl-tRNA(Sec) selenium transferase [Anaeromicrobium sediminis]|uniref:L-seryl-tRNA(Sec) selenium transferase n=1 Tax=Anaeromicrobium sediminis TaxID=1478221 RepID=A0A267MN56_9FIRM|nr:L-seryl-tRNA(Sec) selenium transferase [Anaeromicrobium sediminis]PAB60867.1 L-seryl-tRNA(Sec) selenium transferase [Anaeromicrobium sediminis]